MRNKSALAFIGASTALLTWALSRAFERFPMMPEAASKEAAYVDQAFGAMSAVTVPIFALVISALAYSLWRFRGTDGEGARFDSSRGGLVETLWISASLVLTLGLAAFGANEFLLVRGSDEADLDVQINASQFSWEFYYPATKLYGSRLILPRGKRVRLILNSSDVVHSFWVPQFRLKQDVVPGKVVKLLLTPTKTGTYQLLCSELCGLEHTTMTAWVDVVEPEEFEGNLKKEDW